MRKPLLCYTVLSRGGSALERLAGSPAAWLPPPAAPEAGDVFRVDLRADGALPPGQAVSPGRVWVGEPIVRTGSVRRPVSWSTPPPSPAFPPLIGELDLRGLAGGGVRLLLTAAWEPGLRPDAPGGASSTDVAEATAHAFVLAVADALGEPDSTAGEPHGPSTAAQDADREPASCA